MRYLSMTRSRALLSVFVLLSLACASLLAQRREHPYIILRQAKGMRKLDCTAMAADANGRVKVRLENGSINTYSYGNSIGQYKVAMLLPEPEEVGKLEDLLNDGRYNDLAREAPAVFEKYKYLGWADSIALYYCEALMALKRTDEASKFLLNAARFPRLDEYNLTNIKLLLMVHDNKLAEVEKELARLMNVDNEAIHAFVFNIRGRISEVSGNKKEAILHYLKTFLIFEDRRKFRRFRKEAKANAIRLMKEIGDPAVQIVEGLR